MYCMHTTEKRTQLYLPVHLYQAARSVAQDRRLSLAALVRQALEHYLGRITKSEGNWKNDPLNDLVGFVTKGPKDLSEKVDEFLYK